MEIKEFVDHYYNPKTKTISVTFRIDGDDDEHVRIDEFDVKLIEKTGYYIIDNFDIETDDFPIPFDDELYDSSEDDLEEIIDYEINEDELSSFMSEYYIQNPKKLPVLIIF
jgi:hypothetical protein